MNMLIMVLRNVSGFIAYQILINIVPVYAEEPSKQISTESIVAFSCVFGFLGIVIILATCCYCYRRRQVKIREKKRKKTEAINAINGIHTDTDKSRSLIIIKDQLNEQNHQQREQQVKQLEQVLQDQQTEQQQLVIQQQQQVQLQQQAVEHRLQQQVEQQQQQVEQQQVEKQYHQEEQHQHQEEQWHDQVDQQQDEHDPAVWENPNMLSYADWQGRHPPQTTLYKSTTYHNAQPVLQQPQFYQYGPAPRRPGTVLYTQPVVQASRIETRGRTTQRRLVSVSKKTRSKSAPAENRGSYVYVKEEAPNYTRGHYLGVRHPMSKKFIVPPTPVYNYPAGQYYDRRVFVSRPPPLVHVPRSNPPPRIETIGQRETTTTQRSGNVFHVQYVPTGDQVVHREAPPEVDQQYIQSRTRTSTETKYVQPYESTNVTTSYVQSSGAPAEYGTGWTIDGQDISKRTQWSSGNSKKYEASYTFGPDTPGVEVVSQPSYVNANGYTHSDTNNNGDDKEFTIVDFVEPTNSKENRNDRSSPQAVKKDSSDSSDSESEASTPTPADTTDTADKKPDQEFGEFFNRSVLY